MTFWMQEYDAIDWQSDGEEDFYDESMQTISTNDYWSRNSPMSSRWAYARTKKDEARDVVMELIKIRKAVVKLLQVHGMPKNTQIDLACLGQIGRGCASFHDIGTWKKPYLYLDASVYKDCDASEVMDVYCGIGIHEASHLNHTREMFLRMQSGSLEGRRKLWEGLWEDERIEMLARNESPGFTGYLHAVKRALFDNKEFGCGVDKWYDTDDPPIDMDRLNMIVFAFIRCGHRLTDDMKSWVTLKGRCPFAELRKLFPETPRSEPQVEDYGQKLMDWWDSHREDYDELVKQRQQGGEGDPQDEGDSEEGDGDKSMEDATSGSGDQQQGDQSQGDQPEGDAQDGDSPAPASDDENPTTPNQETEQSQDGSGEGSEGSDKDAPGEDGQGGQEGEQEAQEGQASGDPASGGQVDGGLAKSQDQQQEDFEQRLQNQQAADEYDQNDINETEALDQLVKDHRDLMNKMEKAEDSQNMKEDPAFKKQIEQFDKDKRKLEEEIKNKLSERIEAGRFGIGDLIRMMRRMEIIDQPLDGSETEQLGELEALRVEMGEEWKPDDSTEAAKSVIVHPQVDDRIAKKYEAYRESIKDQIARMRGVFKFRLGKRTWRQKERLSGKLDRRKLAGAMNNPRIFYNDKERTDQGIAIGILIDESGSMGSAPEVPSTGNTGRHGKAQSALQLGVLMSEALLGLPGVQLEVYGFTTTDGSHEDTKFKYLYGQNNKDRRAIANYEHGGGNYDYQAIITAANQMEKYCTEEKKIIFVLSDGAPCGCLGNYSAEELTKMAVEEVRRRGFDIMQVAIEDYHESEAMYGARNVLKFTDIDTFIVNMRTMITRLIRSVTNV